MKQFRAAYVPLFVTISLLGLALGTRNWFINSFDVGWFGAIWNGAVIGGYFLYLYLGLREARHNEKQPVITTLLIIGVAITLAGLVAGEYGQGYWPLVFSAMALAGWPFYLFWYSRYENRDTTTLVVGQALPTLTFEDEAGNKFGTDQFQGRRLLLLFYRGNWCPFCVVQIKELAQQYKALIAAGVEVVLVSPQPHGHTGRLAKRFDVPFHFVVDPGNRVARELGIVDEVGVPTGFQLLGYDSETVMPTVVATDESGTILWADLTDNYRIRPEPATFLKLYG